MNLFLKDFGLIIGLMTLILMSFVVSKNIHATESTINLDLEDEQTHTIQPDNLSLTNTQVVETKKSQMDLNKEQKNFTSFVTEFGQWKRLKGGEGGEGGEGGGFNFKRLFQNFKESIQSEVDTDKVKEKIETIFGKGTSLATKFSDTVTQSGEQGKQKVLAFIDKILCQEKK